MWGAIIGDIAGSIFEFDQIKKVKPVVCKELIPDDGFFSDDTILTVAVANAILTDGDYEKSLRVFGKKYENFSVTKKPYFEKMFSPGFIKWLHGDFQGTSSGNGAMMRISPVGFMFESKEEVKENAYLATIPSHNSKEAIDCATTVALIIFYGRKGFSKQEIIEELDLKYEYKPFQKFNSTCKETIDNCLYALFTSNSFEESVKKVISFGGDTDTNACIVGSMAEAIFGIEEKIIKKAQKKVPKEFCKIIDKMYNNKERSINL